MPIPVHFLIGSPRRLALAIALFIVLDLSVLVINLWIAEQVARDAVAINLAGRQRMLSQQITKTLLLINHAPSDAARLAAQTELTKAFRLFEKTLSAFDQGGVTTGGDGKQVELRRVNQASARASLDSTLTIVTPMSARLNALLDRSVESAADFHWAMDYMVVNNRDILTNMNQLTTELEHDSVSRIQKLRWIQTGAFVLAIVNFLVIVLGLIKQYHLVARAGHHWREVAQHDALTGLFNRSAMRESLEAALSVATQENKTLAVMMLDLDGFKPINDHYGHAAGDAALQAVAATLLRLARESDTVARLGGDEFALVCPNLHGQEHIGSFCDRIVQGIAILDCMNGTHCKVSASIGVAFYPSHGTSVDELLAAADRAMYQSKRAGGNRWSLAELNR